MNASLNTHNEQVNIIECKLIHAYTCKFPGLKLARTQRPAGDQFAAGPSRWQDQNLMAEAGPRQRVPDGNGETMVAESSMMLL